MYHVGLNKSQLVRAKTLEDLKRKADDLMASWQETWLIKQERDTKAKVKARAQETQARSREQKIALADVRSEEAKQAIAVIENLIANALDVDPRIQWVSLKDKRQFSGLLPKNWSTRNGSPAVE
jgi:hypothetical protein